MALSWTKGADYLIVESVKDGAVMWLAEVWSFAASGGVVVLNFIYFLKRGVHSILYLG